MIDIETYDYEEDIDLPKLSDYDGIRKFQDYEFTQCVVYELAIRNPRYKGEVDYVMDFYSKYKKEIDYAIQTKTSDIPREKMKHYGKLIEIQRYISNIETIPFDVFDTKISYKDIKAYGEDFYQLLDNILKYNEKKYGKKKHNQTKLIDKVDIYMQDDFQVTTTLHTINQSIFRISQKNTSDSKESLQILKKYIDHETSHIIRQRLDSKKVLISTIKVQNNFKRPQLTINDHRTKRVMAEIDLSLPEEEIISYIKHLKKTLKDNGETIIPMELLGDLFYPQNEICLSNEKELSKDTKVSLFAKRLFQYDYINTCIKNNKANNSFYENQISKIKNEDDFFLDKTQRIKEAQAHYLENKEITSISKLMRKKEVLKKLDTTFSTLKLHYYAIRGLIIEEQYKRLLSDI